MAKSGTVTLTQIASIMGVSHPVVSKVLNGSNSTIRVNKETAQKIKEKAHELGYFANSAARVMKQGKFNCIALLQSSSNPVSSILTQSMLLGAHNTLAENGMHLIFSCLPDEQLVNDGFVPKILSELFADGLLVNYNASIPKKMLDLIESHLIPSVMINFKQAKNCVYFDDFNSGVQATEYLLKLGHQRIAFINYSGEDHYSAIERKAGYTEAMTNAGLTPQYHCQRIEREETGNFSLELLSGDDCPTGIVSYTPNTFNGIHWAADQLKIRVPEDLSLITFNNIQNVRIHWKYTTVMLPEEELGATAVKMLLDRIKKPNTQLDPVKLKCSLKVGNTTGPVKIVER